jgi:DNA-binding MarR family transcriptional regulator
VAEDGRVKSQQDGNLEAVDQHGDGEPLWLTAEEHAERRLTPEERGDGEPRWLTAEEMEAWLALAALIIKLPAALDAQLQRDSGITHFQYLVMANLSEAPGRTRRMSDLAELTNGSLSRLSHVMSRLEDRGWVRREPCPENGRFTNAILTCEGWNKVVATAPGHVETVRHLVIDALSVTQRRQLRDIGTILLARVEQAAEAAQG